MKIGPIYLEFDCVFTSKRVKVTQMSTIRAKGILRVLNIRNKRFTNKRKLQKNIFNKLFW